MTLLFICIGIIAGSMLFHFPGAVSGGIIGWLFSSVQLLKTAQDKQQQELEWLRSRLSAHLRDEPDLAKPEPDQTPEPEPAVIAAPAPLARPMPTQPAWQQEQPVPKTTVDLTAKTEPAYTFKYTPVPETPAEPSALKNALRRILALQNTLNYARTT